MEVRYREDTRPRSSLLGEVKKNKPSVKKCDCKIPGLGASSRPPSLLKIMLKQQYSALRQYLCQAAANVSLQTPSIWDWVAPSTVRRPQSHTYFSLFSLNPNFSFFPTFKFKLPECTFLYFFHFGRGAGRPLGSHRARPLGTPCLGFCMSEMSEETRFPYKAYVIYAAAALLVMILQADCAPK